MAREFILLLEEVDKNSTGRQPLGLISAGVGRDRSFDKDPAPAIG